MTTSRDALVKTAAIATAVLALLASTPLQAQGADSDDDASAPSDEILDAAITCIAAYDTVLAREQPDDRPAILEARAAAVDLYAQVSGEDQTDIQQDIQQADADLPAELADDGDTLDDYAATCDQAFMDIGGEDDSDPPQIAALAFPQLG